MTARLFMPAVLAVSVALSCSLLGTSEEADARKTHIAAVFYQWFGYEHDRSRGWPATGGLGTFHWNDIVNDQLITGFVVNQPEIGYYASDSDETIAWQLARMEEAGIDTIIVSWWGWGDADLDGSYDGYIEQRSHDALIRLLNYIQSRKLPFKVAIMVEPWPDIVTPATDWELVPGTARDLASEKKQAILDYVWDNVYSVYPDLIFHWHGKPLLAAVGELYFDPEEDLPNDRYTLRNFRFKETDVDPGNAWNWIITEPLPYFQTVDNTVILSPRYDEWFFAAGNPTLLEAWGRTVPVRHDPYLTEEQYDFQWRQVFDRRGDVNLLILWAWNSWMEQLYIEPDSGAGAAPSGDVLLRKTAHYVGLLRSGQKIEHFDGSDK